MRLAVEPVRPGRRQLDAVRLARGVEVVLVRDGVGFHALGHGVLVEHDVVREPCVVLERDGVPGLDRDRRRVEDEGSGVGAELDGGVGVGGERQGEAGDARGDAAGDPDVGRGEGEWFA